MQDFKHTPLCKYTDPNVLELSEMQNGAFILCFSILVEVGFIKLGRPGFKSQVCHLLCDLGLSFLVSLIRFPHF